MYNCLYRVTPACSAGECYNNKNMTQHSLQNCRNPNALLHNSPWYTAQPNLNLPQGSLTFLCGPLLAVTTKSIPAFFLFASFYRGSTPVWFGGGGGGGKVSRGCDTIQQQFPCHLGQPRPICKVDTVCAAFSPVQTVVWLPMLWTFKVHTAV